MLDALTNARLDSLSPGELDALPFGIIQLDERGVILHYNTFESRLTQLSPGEVIGRDFFREVAPCADVQEFRGRFVEGVARQRLDERFRYHFPFANGPRDVLITLFYSATTKSVFVLVQPVE